MTPPSETLYHVINGMKICSHPECALTGVPQPETCFAKSRLVKEGLLAWCKQCSNLAHRRAYHKRQISDPDSFREQMCAKNRKRRQSDGHKEWMATNKEHLKQWHLGWRRDNPERLAEQREKARFKKFNITAEWYAGKLKEQEGRCAICKTEKPGGMGNTFHIDHDHKCCNKASSCGNCLRGLLCASCNVRLGIIENSHFQKAAFAYLNQFRNPSAPETPCSGHP